MKVEVRYQSRGGNTRAVAEEISDVMETQAESIEVPLMGYTDILFIGGGVYGWGSDKALKKYLQALNRQQVGIIVAFSTSGGITATIKKIRECAVKADIPVYEEDFCLRMMLQGHSALGLEGGHLKPMQIEEICEFAWKAKADLGIS